MWVRADAAYFPGPRVERAAIGEEGSQTMEIIAGAGNEPRFWPQTSSGLAGQRAEELLSIVS